MHQADLSPSIALLRLLSGTWITHAIALAAQAGIADRLTQGPRSSADLAEAAGLQAAPLYRVLRALASLGIFQEDAEERFALTPLAELLRSDHPSSLRAFALMLGQEWHWQAWGDLPHSVQTGQSSFEHRHGLTNFAYWAAHPEAEVIFDAAMTSRGADQNAAVVAAGNFTGVERLMDIGGGHGSLLGAILQAHPTLRGVLFDRPEVTPGARAYLAEAGLAERAEVESGDFFRTIPGGADACMLKSVLHDWDDRRARTILENCHQALPEHGRLYLVEWVVPAANEPSFAKLLDLLMLVWTPGGQERTAAEFTALLATAGFALTGVTPTRAGVSLLEAVRT
jgi:SAM-dependent methyltransferase